MSFSKIVSALAASALLAAPVAAQAGTRASKSSVYSAATYSANRASAKIGDDNSIAVFGLLGAALATTAAVVVAVVVNEISKTPGD